MFRIGRPTAHLALNALNGPLPRLVKVTKTMHPTLHPRYVLGFWQFLKGKGLYPQEPGKKLAPGKEPLSPLRMLEELRDYLSDQPDFEDAPTHEEEWGVHIEALKWLMHHCYEALVDNSGVFSHLMRPSTWRDLDGTKLPPGVGVLGSIIMARCLEIEGGCEFFLGKLSELPEEAAEARQEAKKLLDDTHDLARQLRELQSSGQPRAAIEAESLELMAKLDLRERERKLEHLLPWGPLRELVAWYGLRMVDGEGRINGAALKTPLLAELVEAVVKGRPIELLNAIVIADWESRENYEDLRNALDAAGLQHIEVIPLVESRKTVLAYLAGALDGTDFKTLMAAPSDIPRECGLVETVFLMQRILLKNLEDKRVSYRGTGGDSRRGGGGNSPLAWGLFAGGKDCEGRNWLAPSRFTGQGAPDALSYTSDGGLQARLAGLPSPVGEVNVLTEDEISDVEEATTLLKEAEHWNREPNGEFDAEVKGSRLPELAEKLPPAGTRDLANKYAVQQEPLQPGQAGAAAAKAAEPAKGLFIGRRAIGSNFLQIIGYVYFGTGFARIPPERMALLVSAINKIRATGSPGRKYLLDQIMYNFAMQAAPLRDTLGRVKVWERLRFSPAVIEKLGRSADAVINMLEATGYSLDTNRLLQEMLAQDYALPFDAEDLPANVARVEAQLGKMLDATLGYLDGTSPLAKATAMGTLRRNLHTARSLDVMHTAEHHDHPHDVAPSGLTLLELMIFRG